MLHKISILLVLLFASVCQAGFVKPVRGQIYVDRGNLKNRDLIAEWRFSEGTGTNVYDSSGHQDTAGPFIGSTQWASTRGGLGVRFSGSDNGLATVTDLFGRGITRYATFVCQITAGNTATFRGILGDWNSSQGMSIRVDSDEKVTAFVYPNNHRITSTRTINIDSPTHIVMVMNGANMYLYMDGQYEGTDTLGEDIGNVAGVLQIGGRGDLLTDFEGDIHRVSIYKRAFTKSEILVDYRNSINDYFPHRTGLLIYDAGAAPATGAPQVITFGIF